MPWKDPEIRRLFNHQARDARTRAQQADQRANRDAYTAQFPCPDCPEGTPETWKHVPVPDYQDRYEVSDHGRVRRTRDGMVITAFIHKSGYPMVRLARVITKSHSTARNWKVHSLVAKIFLAEDPAERFGQDGKSLTVNHKDGIKTNNHLANLELITRVANIKHGWDINPDRTGMGTKGSKRWNALLHETDIPVILELHKQGLTGRAIAQHYGVSESTISMILRGKTWRHTKPL